jgi:hypothetical protein
LDIDDQLSLLEASTQTLILALQPAEFFQSYLLGLAPTLVG